MFLHAAVDFFHIDPLYCVYIYSVGLGACVYLWSACTSQVTRLCDLAAEGDNVTSVNWNEKVSHELTDGLFPIRYKQNLFSITGSMFFIVLSKF